MTAAPRLLAGKRRGFAAALAALALGEAVLAVLFVAAIDQLLASAGAPLMPLLAAGGIAAMAGAALLLARWLGEDLAQDYLADCRAALFAAVARQAPGSDDARWLTVLLNDMDALHDYALRGTVRLWTRAVSAVAAGGWVIVTLPPFAPGLIPLAGGAGVIALLAWPLASAVAAQRQERQRMDRFLAQSVREQLAGTPPGKGKGADKLSALSGTLRRVSLRRALRAGLLEAAAGLAGLMAALLAVWQTLATQRAAGLADGLAGGLMLLGYVALRLLGGAQAVRARVGGQMALGRLDGLLAATPAPRLRPMRVRPNARPDPGLSRWRRWLPLRFNLNLALPAPPSQAQPQPPPTARVPSEEPEA